MLGEGERNEWPEVTDSILLSSHVMKRFPEGREPRHGSGLCFVNGWCWGLVVRVGAGHCALVAMCW